MHDYKIDIFKPQDMSEEDRKNYAGAIYSIWPYLEKDLKRFLMGALVEWRIEAPKWDEVLRLRGKYDGVESIYQYYKSLVEEHEFNNKGKEPFDKHSPLGSIE